MVRTLNFLLKELRVLPVVELGLLPAERIDIEPLRVRIAVLNVAVKIFK